MTVLQTQSPVYLTAQLLCVGRDASHIEVIWVKREWEYFCKGDSTAND